MTAFDTVLVDVLAERLRQDQEWGADRDLRDERWFVILMEEMGEIAKSLLEDGAAEYEELVQSAAVLVAWLECRHRQSCMEEGQS